MEHRQLSRFLSSNGLKVNGDRGVHNPQREGSKSYAPPSPSPPYSRDCKFCGSSRIRLRRWFITKKDLSWWAERSGIPFLYGYHVYRFQCRDCGRFQDE